MVERDGQDGILAEEEVTMITGKYDRWIKPKHEFHWTITGYGISEVLGASEKEMKEILADGIEMWLRDEPFVNCDFWPFYYSQFTFYPL